jgi:hypothetical protein
MYMKQWEEFGKASGQFKGDLGFRLRSYSADPRRPNKTRLLSTATAHALSLSRIRARMQRNIPAI